MKRTSLIISLFLSLILWKSFAQENFQPGAILTLNGDSVKGLIDFRSWSQNPSAITYKVSAEGEKMVFTPLDIQGFRVDGESYIGAIILKETSPYLLNELKIDPEMHLVTDTTFLYTLVSGIKPLYHYIDEVNKENFYIRTDSGITLLLHKIYIKEYIKEDREILNKYADTHIKTENKSYLGQLSTYMNDCPDIPARLGLVEYSQKSLVTLFGYYQKKCDPSLVLNKERKVAIDLGVISGLSMNTLDWGKNSTFDFSATQYTMKPNMVFGIMIEVKFRGNMNKWSLNNELLYAPFRVEGVYSNYISEERHTNTTTNIGSGYIRMNNMIRFTYPVGKVSVFANAGISNAAGSISHNSFIREIKFYTEETVESGKALERTDGYELGFNLGLGMGYKKWSFDIRWEQGDGMSSLSSLTSKTTKYYALLAYRFL